MALVSAPPAQIDFDDDLDSILNGHNDEDIDALFQPMKASIDKNADSGENTNAPAKKRARGDENDDLGINEEVQISKKRKPVAKLDEERLLSQNGIPKLRRIAGERLKFKGKGHEFSDIARMLNLYQLWLDDLYPRAKFADGLAMIEKLGHTKRMNVMRREWIKENQSNSKDDPKETTTSKTDTDAAEDNQQPSNAADTSEQSLFVGGDEDVDDEDGADNQPEDDELDALLADTPSIPSLPTVSPATTTTTSTAQAEPPEKDKGFEDQYSEEMRMMAEMENW